MLEGVPLLRGAETGVVVLLVPGNHERSPIPRPLLAAHPRLHVLEGPSTVVVERNGGFAWPSRASPTPTTCGRCSLRSSPRRAYREAPAYACPVPPPVRRGGRVRAPARLHVPRRRRRGAGERPAAWRWCSAGTCITSRPSGATSADVPAPVAYAACVERTSFAERDETKGYVMATTGPGARGAARGLRAAPRCPCGRCAYTTWRRPPAKPPREGGPRLDRRVPAGPRPPAAGAPSPGGSRGAPRGAPPRARSAHGERHRLRAPGTARACAGGSLRGAGIPQSRGVRGTQERGSTFIFVASTVPKPEKTGFPSGSKTSNSIGPL